MEYARTEESTVDVWSALSDAVPGRVFRPGDVAYAAEVAGFNLNNELAPEAVVAAESVEDVRQAVLFAGQHAIAVAVKATGHQVVGSARGCLLINVSRLNDVVVDAEERTATVGGGARVQQVLDEAAKFGLTLLAGSAPTVGVVGYTLGGGISPVLGKAFGYASNHVRWIEIVSADGTFRRVDAETDAELFSALRGGKGNFGVVTAMSFDLVAASRFHGGALYFRGEDMASVLHAWRQWAPSLDEQTTTSVMVLHTPPLPELPEPIRGRFVVSVRFAHLGEPSTAQELLEPMRAAAPLLLDAVSELTFPEIAVVHSDPVDPLPYYDASASLSDVTPELVDELVSLVGPGSGSQLFVELRALGGALDRAPRNVDSVPMRGTPYQLFSLAIGGQEQGERLLAELETLVDAVAPWSLIERSPNFLAPEDSTLLRRTFGEDRYRQLASVKLRYDPKNLFRLNHNITPE